jgi:hypothetical protein
LLLFPLLIAVSFPLKLISVCCEILVYYVIEDPNFHFNDLLFFYLQLLECFKSSLLLLSFSFPPPPFFLVICFKLFKFHSKKNLWYFNQINLCIYDELILSALSLFDPLTATNQNYPFSMFMSILCNRII